MQKTLTDAGPSRRIPVLVTPPETACRIIPFETDYEDSWRDYVARHPDATFFHGLGWKRAVERTYGHPFRGLMAMSGRKVVGVLPIHEIRSVFAGRMLVSVPYATYGGVLADTPAIADAMMDSAAALCRRLGARSIEFRSVEAAAASLPIRRSHATFVRALPDSSKGVDVMFPRKARAAARKASEQNDLRVEFDPGQLGALWTLYARSMRRLASPNYPRQFFEELASAHPRDHVVQIVRTGDRPVAGLLSFLFRDRVMPYFVGLDERVDIYGLSQFLYSESMKWGVRHGFRVYDFGRSRLDNPGPFEFKRHCGFEPTVLEYQTYSAPGQSPPDLSPGSPRWSAARRVWRTLPLSITRPLGGWLARSIPG